MRKPCLARNNKQLTAMPKLINPFVEIGKIEGRQEGRQEGESELVLRLVTRKFPTMAKRVKALLTRLDEERLLCFGEALLFMDKPGQCVAWLEENADG